jgi:hypothetical protein
MGNERNSPITPLGLLVEKEGKKSYEKEKAQNLMKGMFVNFAFSQDKNTAYLSQKT